MGALAQGEDVRLTRAEVLAIADTLHAERGHLGRVLFADCRCREYASALAQYTPEVRASTQALARAVSRMYAHAHTCTIVTVGSSPAMFGLVGCSCGLTEVQALARTVSEVIPQ